MDPEPYSIIFYLFVILLLLLGGAYFAASETAFASVNEIRLISYADDGNSRAKLALKIKDNFDAALTTILIGNNIMHISCSSLATAFASKLWGDTAISIVTFVITFVVFLFAETLPKAYAKDCNEKIALALAPSLNVLIILLTPLSFLFTTLSDWLSHFIGFKEAEDITVSEEELFDIIENIDDEDQIEEGEAELVKSALSITVKTAHDILTPAGEMAYLAEEMPIEFIDNQIIHGQYSRYPYFKNGKPLGVLQIRKYLRNKLNNEEKLIRRQDLDKVVYVKEDKPIDELLDYMSKHKTHLAFVKSKEDEFLGILTMEDILEELVGEIYDEEEKETVAL